jgi:class 3 adenylate cyclase
VISALQTYHEEMGKLIFEFEGTIDHRAGDGIMAIFNDPLPCDDPGLQAIRLAVAMREHMREVLSEWRNLGYELGFGVGMSVGYATLGLVGFEGRFDYCANGSVVNLAARLSDEALDGQILISQRAQTAVGDHIEVEEMGEHTLKGFSHPVRVFDVTRLK